MSSRTPLVAGNSGWGSGTRPPDFTPARMPALHFAHRRVPAAIRVANPDALPRLAPQTEEEAFASARFWLDPERRRSIQRLKPPNEAKHAQILQDWVLLPVNRPLVAWWKSPQAWRSPREFPGYRRRMESLGLPHVEPFEVANFRLPDDISCDADVVLFQAWCQGMMAAAFHKDNPLLPRHATAIRDGLGKFASSPWVRFSLAAPHMEPVGVIFPGSSYFDSCLRLEYLLSSPFSATDSELEHILQSGVYKIAEGKAKVLRKAGTYLNPNGNWYVGGSISRALGGAFRRGGLQPVKGTR